MGVGGGGVGVEVTEGYVGAYKSGSRDRLIGRRTKMGGRRQGERKREKRRRLIRERLSDLIGVG